MASTTATNPAPAPASTGTRGPAPPLPEKPPSVAERTRLLRSSFRKEEAEKPKVVDNRASPLSERSTTLPPSNSNGTTNGDKSESPSPASSVSSMTGVGRYTSDKPTPAPVQMENKEIHPPVINAAKREAFFKGGDNSAQLPKFDPSSRFGVDRERIQEPPRKEIDHGKDKEKDKKYGDGTKELDGYVGFASLPNQVYRKSVKKGFEFTLMVVGESGLGKSTLINSLFLSDLYSGDYPGPSHRIQKTVKVETTKTVLKENGVQLQLTVVDTPGFGDAVDNSNCWQPVIDFIDSKYDDYLNSESRVSRITMPDYRVHTCLYFIAPTGHGLKPLDVEFMKRLHDKVNIIPLIAKADTLTPDECREFKKTILNEIARHKIRIYEFPECDEDEDSKIQKKLRDRVPFAVVGSNRVIEAGGKRVRGRQYPWGLVEVENLEHNDFIALRNMLIRTHMQDLKDVTNNVHYENYRYSKLAPSTGDSKQIKPGSMSKDPLSQMAEEKREHDNKMKKMEAEMEQVFEMKVKEKKQKLKDSEADLQRRAEQMKKSLEQQQKELDERWKQFEKEKTTWEDSVGLTGKGSSENISVKKDKKRLF
ncbi:septin-7-like isoform X1 [Pecten maximus]|uniref:septin-7-like isoform X1 n=1 Tax=Pecten maximus TaxID=6579 RepID=UPI00145860B6|nr:septin-7-like isoform X1 [Pecten maximus]